jgi:integrase
VKVGVEHVHFHDLRHTAGTLSAQAGATLKELMARIGHSTPRAAMRYQHAALMAPRDPRGMEQHRSHRSGGEKRVTCAFAASG